MSLIFSPPVTFSFDELYFGIEPLLWLSPFLKKFSRDDLQQHIRWYWNHGTMAWAQDYGQMFTGVCLIKIFDDLEDMDTLYVHVPDGPYLKIEEVVSFEPEAWQQLYDQIHGLWGERSFILWDRRDRTKKASRLYTWKMYLKMLRRLTKKVSH